MSYTVNEIYTQAPSHVLGCLDADTFRAMVMVCV